MAFSTVKGSGGAPDSFVGTTGVDAIAIANSDGNFFVGGNAGNDNIIVANTAAPLYSGVLTTSTVKGGAGRDTMTIGTNGNVSTFTNLFINGNGDRDTIDFEAADSIFASTVKGGAANDTINTGILTSSLVNGNKGVDTITAGAAAGSSTVRGGGGADVMSTAFDFTDGVFAGDLGADRITITGGNELDGSTITGGEGADIIDLRAAGDAGDEGVSVTGDAGDDVINGYANGEGVIDGGEGDDTITTRGGTSTVIGGAGDDTLAIALGTNTVLYNAASDFGAAGTGGSGATVAVGDIITGADVTAVGNIVSGVGSLVNVAASGTAVNFNTNGAVVRTGATAGDFVVGTSTYADLLAIVNTAVNSDVTGDAGDVAVVQFEDTTVGGNQFFNVVVTLGTAAANRALDATDSIALMATVDAAAAAADFTFATA